MPRKLKKPVTLVTVVRMIEDDCAGVLPEHRQHDRDRGAGDERGKQIDLKPRQTLAHRWSYPERLSQAREAGERGVMEGNRCRVDGSSAVAMTLNHRTPLR